MLKSMMAKLRSFRRRPQPVKAEPMPLFPLFLHFGDDRMGTTGTIACTASPCRIDGDYQLFLKYLATSRTPEGLDPGERALYWLILEAWERQRINERKPLYRVEEMGAQAGMPRFVGNVRNQAVKIVPYSSSPLSSQMRKEIDETNQALKAAQIQSETAREQLAEADRVLANLARAAEPGITIADMVPEVHEHTTEEYPSNPSIQTPLPGLSAPNPSRLTSCHPSTANGHAKRVDQPRQLDSRPQ